MNKIILVSLLIFITPFVYADEQKVYVLDLSYSKGSVSVNSISVIFANLNPVTDQPLDGYELKVLSFDNSILYRQKFKFNLEIQAVAPQGTFDESGRQITFPEGPGILENASIELLIPYYPNGKYIDINTPNGTKVLEIPILQFAQTCGNYVCDPQESYESCNKDCPSGGKDDYCDKISDGKCDPDCIKTEDRDCQDLLSKIQFPKINKVIIIIAATLVGGLLLFFGLGWYNKKLLEKELRHK